MHIIVLLLTLISDLNLLFPLICAYILYLLSYIALYYFLVVSRFYGKQKRQSISQLFHRILKKSNDEVKTNNFVLDSWGKHKLNGLRCHPRLQTWLTLLFK